MTFLEVFMDALAKVAGAKVYVDVVHPSAKELGHALADTIRTIRKAGIGQEQAALLHDDLVAFIDRAMQCVPEANRIDPLPQILGPILDHMRFEPVNTPIAEMLGAILARSMDKDRIAEAHPAFVQIIRQLAPDEVRLLRHLAHEPIRSESGWPPSSLSLTEENVPTGLLDSPSSFLFYYAHLESLGLCSMADRSEDDNGDTDLNNRRFVISGMKYWLELYLLPIGEAMMRAVDLTSSPANTTDESECAPPTSVA